MEKSAKIYVAGHKGLVGSAIWKILTQKGYTNLIGKSSSELDLKDTEAVARFFRAEQPEYVFLAAAKVGGIWANSVYRAQFLYENLMIENNVIHQSYLHKVKKLLFLGSTCIYPREAPQPMPEDCLLTSPLEYTNEPYAIAKIAGIKLCESYNLQYHTNFLSVMPTNLYGPNDNFNLETSHVLPALIRKIHLGKCLESLNWKDIRADLSQRPVEGIDGNASGEQLLNLLARYGIVQQERKVKVEIWGTGKPMREFLWSEEMADACVFIMEQINFKAIVASQQQEVNHPEAREGRQSSAEIRNTHINIGTGKEISIKELAALISRTIGFKGELLFDAGKPDGTMRKLTNVDKIHSLGWHHQIEIEQGIEQLYNWYKN